MGHNPPISEEPSLFFVERRGARVTLFGPEGRYSIYRPQRVFTGMGWDAQAASALLAGRAPRSALLLGYGGGTVARQLRVMFPRIRLTGVEIDTRIIHAAARYFSSGDVGVKILAGCGEQYIRDSRQLYDFVLDDMWDHDQERPRAIIANSQWLSSVARRLTRAGVYAANIYSRRRAPADYDVAVRRMRRVFAAVTRVSLQHEMVCVLAGSVEPICPRRIHGLLSRMNRATRQSLAQIDLTSC